MRLVRFEDPVDGSAVDLHPLLTVVTGAHQGARDRLLRALAALPRGGDPGATGSVEVHGVILDLNLESLALLELNDDLDVVLRAADLPGQPSAEEPPSPVEHASLARADLLRTELIEARSAFDQANAAVEEAEVLRAELRQQLAVVNDERRRHRREIEGAREALAPTAEADLHAARDDLAVLARRSEDASTLLAVQRSEIEADLERLIGLVSEQKRELKRLEPDPTSRVAEAIAELDAALDPELVPSAIAHEVADELAALDDRLAMLESRAATSRAQLQELTARRDVAYDAFVAAEAVLRTPELDTDAVDELERVHDEIFELDGRIAKLSAGRLRRRMLELRDRETELLAQMGFESWSSYVMGISSEGAESERKRRYDVAKATYEFAEDEVAKAAGAPMVAGSELADAQHRRRELLEKAAEILGGELGDDPLTDLRDHREPAGPIDPVEAAERLLAPALGAAGAAGVPFDPAEALFFARGWVVDARAAHRSAIEELEERRGTTEDEITRRAAALEGLPSETEAAEPLSDDHPDMVAAQARIDGLIAALDLHRKAAALLAELAALDEEHATREAALQARCDDAERNATEAHALARTAEQLAKNLEAALSEIGDDADTALIDERVRPGGTRQDAGQATDGLEWYVLGRLAQQRSLSFVGSVPLAIDDAFAEWTVDELADVHARLVRMSDVIQVVYLSSDVDVAAWARDLGHTRASVVDLSA